jgi:hypothetical protein
MTEPPLAGESALTVEIAGEATERNRVLALFAPGGAFGTRLEPLGSMVILQPVDQELQKPGSMIALVANNVPVNRGIILAMGPQADAGLRIGDVVQHAVPAKGATIVRENGRVLACMPVEAFVARESDEMAATVRAWAAKDPHPTMQRDLHSQAQAAFDAEADYARRLGA